METNTKSDNEKEEGSSMAKNHPQLILMIVGTCKVSGGATSESPHGLQGN
jgi:hypothetical protein